MTLTTGKSCSALLQQADSEADLTAEELAQPQVQSFVHAVPTWRPHLLSALFAVIVFTGFALCSIPRGGSGHARARNFMGLNDASSAIAPRAMLRVTMKDGEEDVVTTPVDFAESSLKSADAIIVDDGEDVWLWIGENVTKPLTVKARDAATDFVNTSAIQIRTVTDVFEKDGNDAAFRKSVHKTILTPHMFQVTLTDSQETMTTEVKFEKAGLKSDSVFIVDTGKLTSADSVYIWLGMAAKPPLIAQATIASSEYLKTTKYTYRASTVIFEGKRQEGDGDFLALFDGEAGNETGRPEMFQITLAGDEPVLNQVPFDKSLLDSDMVFIVDTGGKDTLDSVYLWLGRDAASPLTTTARDVCSDYIKTTQNMQRSATIVFEGKRSEGSFLKLFDEGQGDDDDDDDHTETEVGDEGGETNFWR